MTVTVQMPNGDLVDFPDNMPDDQIKSMIAKKFPNDVAAHYSNMAQALQSGMSWTDAVGVFAKKYLMQGVPEEQRDTAQSQAGKTLDDVARSVASGATFGYADELAAKAGELTGVGGKKGDYAGNLAAQKARDADIPASISVPGQIAGGVASTAAAAPILGADLAGTAIERLPSAVKSALGGAAVGGLEGSGNSEPGLENRLKGAAEGAAGGAITAGAVSGLGKLIGAAGDKIMTSVIKPSQADVKDGFSINTVKEFGLGGSLKTTLNKTQAVLSDLSDQLRQKLAASDAKIDLTSVYDKTEQALTTAGKDKLKSFGAQQSIKASLDRLQNEVLLATNGQPLSIPDAQVVKQAAGGFGAWQYGRPDPDSKASEIVYNAFYHNLKTEIEKASPEGVKEINQKLSKLIPVQNAVIRRLPIAERNNIISFPEMIGFMGSMVHPQVAGASLVNMMSRSGTVGSGMSRLGPRIANPQFGASAAASMMLGKSALTGQ